MSDSETFNQKRMNRAAGIQKAIMENWQKTNRLTYIVRATQRVAGTTLDDLRKQYFSVGVSEQNLAEIPFIDLLVVFSMIEQHVAALQAKRSKPGKAFTLKFRVTTKWPDEEAARLLSGIQIETPFDAGKFLRLAAERRPVDESGDDPEE